LIGSNGHLSLFFLTCFGKNALIVPSNTPVLKLFPRAFPASLAEQRSASCFNEAAGYA